MDAMTEYRCRSRLKWTRDGLAFALRDRRRRVGRVVPDNDIAGMYRSIRSDGRQSDVANLTWAKDAALGAAIRDMAWEDANTPSKCLENRGVKTAQSSLVRSFDRAATTLPSTG